MDTQPRIIYVERLSSGVVIEFEDGKTALYSAKLLYEALPNAQKIGDSPADE